jgi:hypothetical protein
MDLPALRRLQSRFKRHPRFWYGGETRFSCSFGGSVVHPNVGRHYRTRNKTGNGMRSTIFVLKGWAIGTVSTIC